MIQVYI